MSKVVAVIQGRMASHRLPGKLLAAIDEVPLLDRLVHRTGAARVDEWWLATTSQPEDDEAAAAAQRLGLAVFRGSPADVLSRFAEVARRTAADLIVRLTADNPFTNANVIDLLLADAALLDGAAVLGDYGAGRRLPLGFCPELVRADALLDAGSREMPAHHRVHVTSWLHETERGVLFEPPLSWPARPRWRWTIDTPQDLAMANAAYSIFRRDEVGEAYPAMVASLDQHPDVVALNEGVRQKAVAEG